MASLTTDIAAEIGRLIVAGTYSPGTRLTEKALMERFGASRGTIRTALRALVSEGIVEIHDNRGVYVKALSLHDALELYELRAELTAYAARLVADAGEAEVIQRLEQLQDQMRACVEAADAEAYYSLNLAFHAALLEGCRNRRAALFYEGLVRESHLHRQPQLSSPAQLRRSLAEHQDILEAIRSADPAKASDAARAHVLHGRNRYVATSSKGGQRP